MAELLSAWLEPSVFQGTIFKQRSESSSVVILERTLQSGLGGLRWSDPLIQKWPQSKNHFILSASKVGYIAFRKSKHKYSTRTTHKSSLLENPQFVVVRRVRLKIFQVIFYPALKRSRLSDINFVFTLSNAH